MLADLVATRRPPVLLTTFVDLDEAANMFSFEFEFLSNADGLLSVYF